MPQGRDGFRLDDECPNDGQSWHRGLHAIAAPATVSREVFEELQERYFKLEEAFAAAVETRKVAEAARDAARAECQKQLEELRALRMPWLVP